MENCFKSGHFLLHFSFLSKESQFHWPLLITRPELSQAKSLEAFYWLLVESGGL